jgi:hypothetical protein
MLLHPFMKSLSRREVDQATRALLSSLEIERARLLSEDQTHQLEDVPEQRLATMSMSDHSQFINQSRFHIDAILRLDLLIPVPKKVDTLVIEADQARVKQLASRRPRLK